MKTKYAYTFIAFGFFLCLNGLLGLVFWYTCHSLYEARIRKTIKLLSRKAGHANIPKLEKIYEKYENPCR